jgi:hypothetical protein
MILVIHTYIYIISLLFPIGVGRDPFPSLATNLSLLPLSLNYSYSNIFGDTLYLKLK